MTEWRHSRWGDLATLEYGKSLRGYQNAAGQYPVFGTNGPIGHGPKPLCEHPGVIIGRKGAYRGVHYSDRPFWVIDTAFYLEPKADIDLKWAYYELLTHDINAMDSGSAIPSTSRAAFYALPVRVPPLAEQRRIAHTLGGLDDKIELNRRMNHTLESIARAIFKSWFVDFDPVRKKMVGGEVGLSPDLAALFPDSLLDSNLGVVPSGWQVGRCDEDFSITMGQSPPGETYNDRGAGMPFYQGRRDFGERYPRRRVFCTAPSRRARAGDTLVSVRAPVGDVNVAREDCSVGRGLAAVRHSSGAISYTFEMMRSLRSVFDDFESGGTVFGAIGGREFKALPVVIPPRAVIDAFEGLVVPFTQLLEGLNTESLLLGAARGNLLVRLFQRKDARR